MFLKYVTFLDTFTFPDGDSKLTQPVVHRVLTTTSLQSLPLSLEGRSTENPQKNNGCTWLLT